MFDWIALLLAFTAALLRMIVIRPRSLNNSGRIQKGDMIDHQDELPALNFARNNEASETT